MIVFKLQEVTREVERLLEERNALRGALNRSQIPIEGEAARTLKEALDGKDGWRERARQVLGLYVMIECIVCGSLFPSGGKRRESCSPECVKLARKLKTRK